MYDWLRRFSTWLSYLRGKYTFKTFLFQSSVSQYSLLSLLQHPQRLGLDGVLGRTLAHLGHLVLVLPQLGIERFDLAVDRIGARIDLEESN